MPGARDETAAAERDRLVAAAREVADAFARVPRPSDDDLLHPRCRDDNDIAALYRVPGWPDVPAEVVEREYAALFFLSPAGFRHFLPAYLLWVLGHPDSGAAVVESTILALTPQAGELRDFALSKFSLLEDRERAAVRSFLMALAPYQNVAAALPQWPGPPQDQLPARPVHPDPVPDPQAPRTP